MTNEELKRAVIDARKNSIELFINNFFPNADCHQ